MDSYISFDAIKVEVNSINILVGHRNELEFRELDVLPGKTLVKKGHYSVKILQVISKIKLDMYFSIFFLSLNFD